MKRTDFATELARRRADAGFSLADLAARAHVNRGYVHRLERGERWPSFTVVRAMDAALAAEGALLATWEAANRVLRAPANDGQPTELLELAARAKASDVGATTLELVELSVDGLARSYTRVPPDELLHDVRTRARQIGSLLGRRATLAQRRRLLIAAGWHCSRQPCTWILDSVVRRVLCAPSRSRWAVRPSRTKSVAGCARSTPGRR
jgi:transcriptional regulator with XRE-family HTH domain